MIVDSVEKRAVDDEVLSLKRDILSAENMNDATLRLREYLTSSLADSSKVCVIASGQSILY